MKIKEIFIESLKSPFFNILAIVNLALIATAFSNSFPALNPSGTWAVSLNLPALVMSRILAGPIYQSFILVPPLVYLQWIFIGAFAKSIASHLKPKTD